MPSQVRADAEAALEAASPIVDLRQYTLLPGTRDAFVELFDRELVETQEAAGMRIIGQFRDLGDPNRFVWMRGFADMPSRQKALTGFYMHGDAWKAHGPSANAMMIDSTDALLLRPLRRDGAFLLPPADQRPKPGAPTPQGLVAATLYNLAPGKAEGFHALLDAELLPLLRETGARLLGLFATEHSPNNFERLPLRQGEDLVVTFAAFDELSAYHRHMEQSGKDARWQRINSALPALLAGRAQTLRLAPTSRSLLRA